MIAVTPVSVEHPSRGMGTRPLVETGRKLIPLFLVSVSAIYVQLALLLPAPLFASAHLLLGLTCLAYLALGTVGYWFVNQSRAAIWLFFYFVTQLILGSAMLFLSPVRGSIVLVLFPLVAQAVVLLSPTFAISVTVMVSLATVLESAISTSDLLQGVVKRIGALAAFGFTYWFGRVVVREELGRQRAEGLSLELRDANDRLKDHAAQTHELGVMRERERLAREVHDGLGHYLTAIAIQNEAARELMSVDTSRTTEALAKVQSLAQEALADVRRSINAWHIHQPAVSLSRQVELLVNSVSGLDTALTQRGASRPVALAIEHTLIRILQEGLTNVRKHARARRVEVLLEFGEPAGLRLEIADDGVGPRPHTESSGFGLNGVRERMEMLGGRMDIGRSQLGGFVLRVEVPE